MTYTHQYNIEPAPQGNFTVRFRAVLGDGEKISHKPVPFVYTTKDYWRTEMHARPMGRLTISPGSDYVLQQGKNAHTLVHKDVADIPRRERNRHHPIPVIYVNAKWWEQEGTGYSANITFEGTL